MFSDKPEMCLLETIDFQTHCNVSPPLKGPTGNHTASAFKRRRHLRGTEAKPLARTH